MKNYGKDNNGRRHLPIIDATKINATQRAKGLVRMCRVAPVERSITFCLDPSVFETGACESIDHCWGARP